METIAPILLVAFVGSINPSSGDLGMLVPLEHALLTKETADRDRTAVFARYSLIGSLTSAVGSLAAALPEILASSGWSRLSAIKLMFYAYAMIGVLAAVLYRRLPRDQSPGGECARRLRSGRPETSSTGLRRCSAWTPLPAASSCNRCWRCGCFSGSTCRSKRQACIFFCASLLGAISFPVAAWLSRRIGLINTMVFTHIPSSICLIAAAFCSSLTAVLSLLLIRSALSQMDVPTRSSYVMAVVTPAERTAAASVTAVPRSLASSISPAIAGLMLAGPFSGLPLVVCGCLKIGYDLALLRMFRHTKPPEEIG